MTPFRRICVYAGSAPGASPVYVAAATELAAAIVRRGAGIVYGGGSVGMMGAVADAALAAGGDVVGVMPRFLEERELRHPGVTDVRVTETMHERKLLMADLADAFVVLPGGVGTLEEVVEMLSWSKLGLHRKPIGLLDTARFWRPLNDLLDHMIDEEFLGAEHRRLLLADAEADALLGAMESWDAPDIGRRWLRSDQET